MATKPKSVSTLSKQLNMISERIKERKQSDLRFTVSAAKSLVSVARAYQTGRKNGLTAKDTAKIDLALEKALAE